MFAIKLFALLLGAIVRAFLADYTSGL